MISQHFFYRQLKDITENGRTWRYRVSHSFELSAIAYLAIRFMQIIIALAKYPQYKRSGWEPFGGVFSDGQHFDVYFLSCGIIFCFDALAFQVALYLTDCRTFSRIGYYDLVVTSLEAYWSCCKTGNVRDQQIKGKSEQLKVKLFSKLALRLLPTMVVDKVCQGLAYVLIHINLEHVSKKKLKKTKLVVYDMLSFETRLKLLTAVVFFDKFFVLVKITFALHIAIAFLPYWLLTYRNGLLFLDLFFLAVVLWLIIRDSIFLLHYILITCSANWTHIHEGNATLLSVIKDNRLAVVVLKQRLSSVAVYKIRRFIWQCHHRVYRQIALMNGNLLSTLILLFILLNILTNIIAVHRLLFRFRFQLIVWSLKFTPIEPMLILYVILVQMVQTALCLVPLARTNAELKRIGKYLPALMPLLDRTQLEVKWKVDTLFQKVVTNRRIGNSIGPGLMITFNVLLEFVLSYVAYMFCIFNYLMEQNK